MKLPEVVECQKCYALVAPDVLFAHVRWHERQTEVTDKIISVLENMVEGAEEREASDDIAAGRVTRHANIDAMFEHLDRD